MAVGANRPAVTDEDDSREPVDQSKSADPDDAADPDEAGVLDPEDLDIRSREGVEDRGEGRYVISTGAASSGTDGPEDGRLAHDDGDASPIEVLRADLADLSAPHALALAAKTGDDTDVVEVASTDPAEVFAAVARWYATRLDPDGDPDRALAALLAAAGLVEDRPDD